MGESGEGPLSGFIELALCGDVMLGRGVDQILPHPGDPRLYESNVNSALSYVALAEAAHGPIPRPVDFTYVWGDALEALQAARPDLLIVNLETSVTRSRDYLPKGINYKMNPENVACLTAAKVDCCVLANNHVLDWGWRGLAETLETLEQAGIRTSGAGNDAEQAAAPAVFDVAGKGSVWVFAFGSEDSGIPADWAAGRGKPGVNFLGGISEESVSRIAGKLRKLKRPGTVFVASIHWGGNWGYRIPDEHRRFAHGLIDQAGFDLVHGHSSHHAKGIEVYKEKLILYGCGDFLNDYEGIGGYERFRSDLAVLYLPRLSWPEGKLVACELMPFQIRNFRLSRASNRDVAWLRDRLDRESAKLGGRIVPMNGSSLALQWR